MAGKKGPRGRRSPCPNWWVDEANRRLRHRGLTKKQLAAALNAKGRSISETMVVRCLLDDEHRRIATIEAIEAISDALGLPRPVVVADSFEQAMEIQAAVHFSAVDADVLALAAQVEKQRVSPDLNDDGSDAEKYNQALGEGRPRAPRPRPAAVRRASRTR